jgi:quercetin dioxygenase-like cupin family protein
MYAMTVTPLRRDPSGPAAGATSGLPLSLVARFAASFAAAAEDWPDQPADGGPERSSVRVAVTPTHDVWLIRWPAGTRVRPHDHGSSLGAFSVVRGELEEVRWDADGTPRSRLLQAGETGAVDRGVVHDVRGVSADALSVHVYSPPLSSMAIYDDEVDSVIDIEVVGDDQVAACDPASWRALASAAGVA